MDDWLPPVVRERQPFGWLTKVWLGPKRLPDFKDRAFTMTDAEYCEAYRNVSGAYTNRGSDTTDGQKQWLLNHVGQEHRVLEIGPGKHALCDQLARSYDVTTLDLHPMGPRPHLRSVVGMAERLPFRDKSFDTTIICMVLEHVRSLTVSFLELERVTRHRVLIVTPQQRFYRVTFDYHLHFFYSLQHLASHVHTGKTEGNVIDGDLCLCWQVDERPRRH
jgi:hypothetical protein